MPSKITANAMKTNLRRETAISRSFMLISASASELLVIQKQIVELLFFPYVESFLRSVMVHFVQAECLFCTPFWHIPKQTNNLL